METIVCTKNPWQVSSDDWNSMVDAAWKLAIKAQDCQYTWVTASVVSLCVSQLRSGLSLTLDAQTDDAVSVWLFCSMLFYWTYIIV
jgi:hypothetical protein